LGITYDGDPPDVLDVLKIGRRYVKFCAELFALAEVASQSETKK